MKEPKKDRRILFCWFSQPHLQDAVKSFIQQNQFDSVGLIARENFLGEQSNFFLPARNARKKCNFPNHKHRHVPSRAIIEAMRPTEAEALKMMDRSFKSPFKPHQYEFRKRLYYAQLCMAYGILKEQKFTTVIWSNIPHNSFDFILFGLCKIMEIEAKFLFQLQVKDCFLQASSIQDLFSQLEPTKDYKAKALPEHLEEEIQLRLNKESPFYMSAVTKKTSKKCGSLIKRLFRIHTYSTPFYALPSWRAFQALPKSVPSPDQKFVYFALHMQPEATTSPLGGVFVDQYYVILTIARALPDEVTVVVKEHPKQKLWRRSPDFYKTLAAEPNVSFAPTNHNSFELLEKAIAVATITGTVGWDALILGKPILLFGHIFYKHLPGVVNVNQPEDLQLALQQILGGTFKNCTIEDIKLHLSHLNDISYQGAVNGEYFRNSSLPKSTSVKSVQQALTDITSN